MIREPESIRRSARGRDCAIRLPGICNFNKETTVYAHVNGIRFGKGMGYKSNFGAYGCSACHAAVDSNKNVPHSAIHKKSGLSALEIKLAFLEGVIETSQIMLEEGLLNYGK